MRSFPPDVLVINRDDVRHIRFVQSRQAVTVSGFSKSVFPESPFDESWTPALTAPEVLRSAIERLRARRRFDRASVLLPDSWFRTQIVELDSLPESRARQEEAVRWVLRKSMPNRQEQVRLAWQVISKSSGRTKVLVLFGLEKSIEAIESAIRAAAISPILVEPTGLNLWNAIAIGEDEQGERLLVIVESGELTMILFRDDEPLFLRSKKIDNMQSLTTELRLSTSFLRSQRGVSDFARVWVAGEDATDELVDLISREVGTAAERPTLSDLGIQGSSELDSSVTTVMSAMGVFAA